MVPCEHAEWHYHLFREYQLLAETCVSVQSAFTDLLALVSLHDISIYVCCIIMYIISTTSASTSLLVSKTNGIISKV